MDGLLSRGPTPVETVVEDILNYEQFEAGLFASCTQTGLPDATPSIGKIHLLRKNNSNFSTDDEIFMSL